MQNECQCVHRCSRSVYFKDIREKGDSFEFGPGRAKRFPFLPVLTIDYFRRN